ncbi:MAG: DHA2 family efflux MFS transporter permease subunit [Rhodanobacteraceae bacterium]
MASTTAYATRSFGQFRPANLGLATIGLSLGTFMQVLDMSIANVSLPTIAGDLAVSQDQSTWVITSFTVAQAITLPMTGFLSRRFGEVKVFVTCVLLFSLFSLCDGLATSLAMLVIFRILQGAACGPMYPITQSLMVQIYPREKMGVALAIISMITVVAPIVGPVLGGYITDSYSWRWIFLINVPIGIFSAALVWSQLHERVEKLVREHIDWIGAAALIIGIGSLQILLDKGQDLDWFASHVIVALGIIAAIALTVWVVWELTEEQPLVDLRLFRRRNFASGTLAMTLGYALFFAIPLILPLWMQGTLGYTALWAGLATAPFGVLPLLLTYWIGKYASKVDLRLAASFSFVVMGLVCFRFGQFNTGINFGSIAMAEFAIGLGVAFFFMPVLTIALSELEGPDIAEGSGSMTFMRTVGASFGISIVTYLWDRGGAVSHANLAEVINPFNDQIRSKLAVSPSQLQHYAAGINRMITEQGMQVSFNHLFDGLGVVFFLLILLVWFAKPPFISRGHSRQGSSADKPSNL